ncbi:MAG: hypothetical protein ACXVW4_15130 [Nocardioides sp.]
MSRYAAPAAGLLVLALAAGALAGCTGDRTGSNDPTPSSAGTGGSPTGGPSGSTPSSTPAASPSTSGAGRALPPGGTAERPLVLTAGTDLLDWSAVPGSVQDTVTTNGPWRLSVTQDGSESHLEGPGSSSGSGSSAGSRDRVTDALLDADWAVVVTGDRQESRPSRAEVTDLATGRSFTLDGSSDVPTTTGGTWALGQGHLLHATVHRGAYCIASVDLASRTSRLGWCAPARHGFSAAHVTPAGDSLLTFDDSHPSCRTLVSLDGTAVTPLPGVPDCKGWDALLTPDGAVWSVVPKETQVEAAHFYARSGRGYYDLGPGNAGSLLWCGGSAYFGRDPQRQGDPARLMRWTPGAGLDTVYASRPGHAFLAESRCGGDVLTVTSLSQGGDEQVSARTR